ncbi:hypothetical protein BJV77DRAFT_963066 [Russula vinacea]|nr:hypothetical protein BJV77DRAFT_963066 [Russula vinacea]
MALEHDCPVVQFVQFRANDRCLADPSLFQAVRDTAQGWQEKGLNAQYWGTSVLQANEFYWLLFWQSYAHATAIKADPSYPSFFQNREALVAAPVFEIHAPLSGDPQPERTLKAPVTEVDFYRTDDIEVNPDSKPAAAIHDMVVRVNYHIESLQLPGYISQNWGFAFEDGRWAIVLRGWESIEDHMRLGMLDDDGHRSFVQQTEEIFKSLTEVSVGHAYIKSHDVPVTCLLRMSPRLSR